VFPDFVLEDDEKTICLVGPGGSFTFGFHVLNTLSDDAVENYTFRVYYRKSSSFTIMQNYYLLKGTQWITTTLPTYGALTIMYHTADNEGRSFSPENGLQFYINRLSVMEML
jgi:hypothetical protein